MGALASAATAGAGKVARTGQGRAGRVGALRHGEVHAWIIDLDAPADRPGRSGSLLDDAERDRTASYLSPRDGARFAASRTGLRRILGRYLGAEPAALSFRTAPSGRPVLAGQHGCLQFSLSRSAGVGLLAVSAGPVGADVEAIVARDGLADLAAARFGPVEAACIASGGCAGSALHGFYRHWTAREAWLKAVGIGLTGLTGTEFDCRNDLAIRFRDTARAVPDLRLQLLDISPAYAAAVAAAGPVTTCRRLPPGPARQ
jgi:4'-phosphopantetheinyl transferase